ncbi:MAG: hypothetical protein ACWGMZ_03300 [Thermoguttaceae bacterium]
MKHAPILFGWLICLVWFFSAISPLLAQTVRTVGPFDLYFYNSGEGDETGYSSQNWTNQQIDDVTASIAAWANRITDTPGRQIKLHLLWQSLPGNALGITETQQVGDGSNLYSLPEYVWRESETYTSPKSYDAWMAFDTGSSWNFGSATPDVGYYDFRSVFTHEVGHTLGFFSTYIPSTDKFADNGLSMWDKNIMDSSGNRPEVNGEGTHGNFNQVDNPVYFTGANAIANYGGNIPIYAPSTYEEGSSLSHLDETLLPNALMSPQLDSGTFVRKATELEWEIMKDFGWSVATVHTWSKGAGSLAWGSAANWDTGLPDAVGNVNFTNTGLSNGDTILLGDNRTINALSIDSTTSFTIGGSSGILTVRNGYITRSSASSGVQTIARPVVVGDGSIWDISGDGSLTLSNSLTSSGSLFKIGAGAVALSGTASIAGTLNIDNGDWTVLSGGLLTADNLAGLLGTLNFDGGTLNLTGTNNIHLYGVRVGKNTVGSFTLAAGKSVTADVFLTIGRDSGGNGTFTNNGTVTCNTNLFAGANTGSYGHYIQQSGGVTNVADMTCAGYQSGSTGVIDLNAGTLTTDSLYAGYLGSGTVAISGATVSATTTAIVGLDSGSVGVLNVNSGTFNAPYLCSGYDGTGTVTQTGGIVTLGSGLILAYSGQGAYNLNGGTLKLDSLTKGTGTAAFNFGGGVLQATDSFSTAVALNLSGANGDATIDTQAYNMMLTNAVSGNGGLVKDGAGTLNIAAAADYLGDTTISDGLLQLSGATSALNHITGAGDLLVGDGVNPAEVMVNSISVHTLTIAAGAVVRLGQTGTLSGKGLHPVPEPAEAVLLLFAALSSLFYRCLCQRKKISP